MTRCLLFLAAAILAATFVLVSCAPKPQYGMYPMQSAQGFGGGMGGGNAMSGPYGGMASGYGGGMGGGSAMNPYGGMSSGYGGGMGGGTAMSSPFGNMASGYGGGMGGGQA